MLSVVFVVLWFELRAWYLLGRCSTTRATPPALNQIFEEQVTPVSDLD
jgi:hypothetical protein